MEHKSDPGITKTGGRFSYVIQVIIISVIILPIIYVDIMMRTTESGLLYFVSIPSIVVLGGLSFIFHDLYRAQSKLGWRLFVLLVNSLLAFGFGMLITQLFIAFSK